LSNNYDALWRTAYVLLMGGERIFYENLSVFQDPAFPGHDCCTLFSIKQRLTSHLADDILVASGLLKKGNPTPKTLESSGSKRIGTDVIADRLKDHIRDNTRGDMNRPLSSRITADWQQNDIETFFEENCPMHWMTAAWYQQYDTFDAYGDFAFLIKVHAPIIGPTEKFMDGYGENFVMTKLIHY